MLGFIANRYPWQIGQVYVFGWLPCAGRMSHQRTGSAIAQDYGRSRGPRGRRRGRGRRGSRPLSTTATVPRRAAKPSPPSRISAAWFQAKSGAARGATTFIQRRVVLTDHRCRTTTSPRSLVSSQTHVPASSPSAAATRGSRAQQLHPAHRRPPRRPSLAIQEQRPRFGLVSLKSPRRLEPVVRHDSHDSPQPDPCPDCAAGTLLPACPESLVRDRWRPRPCGSGAPPP